VRRARAGLHIGVIGEGVCSRRTAALAERVGRAIAEAGAVLLCGGLGGVMEAASRGAARVVMVEHDRDVFSHLENFKETIKAVQVDLVNGDAFRYLEGPGEQFDVVFLDPPFRQNALPALLKRLPDRLKPGARVYIEAAAPIEAKAPWQELRAARAGQVSYQLLEWGGDDQGRLSGNV